MVEMRVAEKQVGLDFFAAVEMGPEFVEPRAGVEDNHLFAAAHFDTGGIAAVANGARARAGNTSPHTPESDVEVVAFGQASSPTVIAPPPELFSAPPPAR